MNKHITDGPFIKITDFFMAQFDVLPLDGYKYPINEVTNKLFPFCCEYHSSTINILNAWIADFPNCCPEHKKIAKKWWFKKDNYENLPLKIITLVSYSQHVIEVNINLEDGYDVITDYIEYCVMSFGQPGVGICYYLDELKKVVSNDKFKTSINLSHIGLINLNLISELIDTYFQPQNNGEFHLEILYDTYQKWLKAFPFNIVYFKNLKSKFEQELPILNGVSQVNRFSKLACSRVLTRKELIQFLIKRTTKLLDTIDSSILVENKIITDADKHLFELATGEHKLKQASLLGNYKKVETQYVEILYKWLTNEKEYFQDIGGYLKKQQKNLEIDNAVIPVFKKEIVESLFLCLKDFFELDMQDELKQILTTGKKQNVSHLLFKDKGNRLTDAFRKLKESDIIISCSKKELEYWINLNFKYLNKRKPTIYTLDYLEKCISRKDNPCMNPLFVIKNGEIIKK